MIALQYAQRYFIELVIDHKELLSLIADLFRRFPALKNRIKSLFNMIGIEIRAKYKFMPELWSNDLEFEELYSSITGVTKVSKDRCFMIHQLSKYSGCLEGDMAEVGVYKGGTAKLIALSCQNKKIHLFDTFSGMPKVSQVDKHREKDFSDTCLKEVKSYLKDCHNVNFYPGFFPETAKPLADKVLCFVYIDVDLYQSTKACLEFFFPRMVSFLSIPKLVAIPALITSWFSFIRKDIVLKEDGKLYFLLLWSYFLLFYFRASHGRYLFPISPIVILFFLHFLRNIKNNRRNW